MLYNKPLIEIVQSATFRRWHDGLKDRAAILRIDARLRRLSEGNAGDVRPVGEGLSELRIDHGPGYRVYFLQRGHRLVVLLAGGDKGTQATDIAKAALIAREWKD